MEENNNIDELFQQGLKQDFPFDGNLWNQVESQLPTPSSPKRGLWVFHLNSLWVLALLSISMILKTDTNIPITTEINTPEHMTGSQLLPVEKTSVSKVESSKPNSSLVETSAIIKENQTNLKQEKTKIETPLFEDKASKKINAESPKLDKNSRYSKKIDKNQSFIVSNKLGLTIPAIDVDNDRLRLNENEEEVFLNENVGTFPTLEEMSSLDYNYEEDIYFQPQTINTEYKIKKKPYYYYEIELSRSLMLEKEVSLSDTQLESYKLKAEKSGSSSNFGLNVLSDYKFLQVGLGIHRSKFSESINYVIDAPGIGYDVSFDTSYSVVNGTFNSNGVPVLLIKQEVQRIETEKGILIKKDVFFRNEFERIQVPVLLGVHKHIGRFYGNLRTSINLNYTLTKSGAYISNDYNRINNFESTEQIKQFNISNAYSASLGYSLNEFVVIGTRFNYEADLTSFTKEYSSKFNQYGLGIWLMWRPR